MEEIKKRNEKTVVSGGSPPGPLGSCASGDARWPASPALNHEYVDPVSCTARQGTHPVSVCLAMEEIETRSPEE